MKNIIGRKVGMTSVFTADGRSIPVTVISAGPCTVLQRKTAESDGYESVALAFGDIKKSRLNTPMAGHYKKAGLEGRSVIREFRDGIEGIEVGQTITVTSFEPGDHVDVVGHLEGPRLLRRDEALELRRRRREPRLDDPSPASLERRHQRRSHDARQPPARALWRRSRHPSESRSRPSRRRPQRAARPRPRPGRPQRDRLRNRREPAAETRRRAAEAK